MDYLSHFSRGLHSCCGPGLKAKQSLGVVQWEAINFLSRVPGVMVSRITPTFNFWSKGLYPCVLEIHYHIMVKVASACILQAFCFNTAGCRFHGDFRPLHIVTGISGAEPSGKRLHVLIVSGL